MGGPEEDGRGSSATGPVAGAEIVVDARGRIVHWSEQAEKLLGYRSSAVSGRPAAEFFVARDRGDGGVAGLPQSGTEAVLRSSGGAGIRCAVRIRPTPAGERGAWSVDLTPVASDAHEVDDATLEALFQESPIGLAVFGPDLRLRRYNPSAENLKGIFTPQSLGLRPSEIWPRSNAASQEPLLSDLLATGKPMIGFEKRGYPPDDPDHEYVFSASAFRLHDREGHVIGFASTAFDITARRLAEERLALLARASGTVGSTLDVMRTGQELADIVVPDFADAAAVDVVDSVLHGREPDPGGNVESDFRRIGLRYSPGVPAAADDRPLGAAVFPFPSSAVDCLTELAPSLGSDEGPPQGDPVGGTIRRNLVVPLCARGVKLGVLAFYRYGRAFDEGDILTANELATRAALAIDNARRYTQEHTIARALQLDLLPSRLPRQSAVETAHRVVAAGAGTDWMDVIPVSGARVALVVGSLKGAGLYAAAAMGRLRTVVHALAALDLSPDEVLARLDALVSRITLERGSGPHGETDQLDGALAGATCLYAIYDPTSGQLTLSSAGHPVPAVAPPDGEPWTTEVPVGGRLGSGHTEFGTVTVDVSRGSTLGLYTPGLLASSGVDEFLGLMAALVSSPGTRTLQILGDKAIGALLPEHPDRDATLLLARTHILGEDQVATWDLPSDPAVVATARTLVDRQLTAWHIDELNFPSQLITSELVTNAIRHGKDPITLRLLRDEALICEVSDGSTIAPHLRHAAISDEGGRGLFMTAELTQRWGTRYTERGKTIWTEQDLPVQG
ncbi:SpoIIE family protein phosphatase [Streptomyces sp. NBC_00433]